MARVIVIDKEGLYLDGPYPSFEVADEVARRSTLHHEDRVYLAVPEEKVNITFDGLHQMVAMPYEWQTPPWLRGRRTSGNLR